MTELSGGGASNAPSASNAIQAAGGTSSQNNAVANSGMTPEQQKAVDDFNNYKIYTYKEKNSDRATIDNLEKRGQISKETASEYRGYVDKGADIGFTETEMKVISAPAQKGSELNADGTYRLASNKVSIGKAVTLNDVVKNEIPSNVENNENNGINLHIDQFGRHVPDVVSYSQTRTVTPEMIQTDYETPTTLELYKQTLKSGSSLPSVFGTIFKTVETLTIKPETGEFSPVAPVYHYGVQNRLQEWENFDKSGIQRQYAGLSASMTLFDIVTAVVGGGVISSGIKGIATGLGKASTTKIGQIVVPKLTNPLIKAGTGKASQTISRLSSPINLAANTGTVALVGNMGSGVASAFQDSKEKGIDETIKLAITLPAGAVGGAIGYKATSQLIGKLETRGLKFIPAEKVGVEGIPLSNKLSQDNLKVSFAKNVFYPEPDKIAETNKINQAVSESAKLPKHPDQTEAAAYQIFHATNRPFGKTFEVAESQSEIPNMMYGAPKAETYFTRIQGESKSKPGLFVDIQPSSGGEILNIKGTAVKPIDYEVAARDLKIPIDNLRKSPDLQYKAANYYLSKYGKEGEFYIPGIKAEYEAGTKVGTKYRRLPSRYYTEVDGVRVKISEYEPVLGTETTPKTSGKAGTMKKYSYKEYNPKSQRIPLSYSQGVSSKLSSILKGSKSRNGLSSLRSYTSSLKGSTSRRGGSESKTASDVSSISSIVYGDKSHRSTASSVRSGSKFMDTIKTGRKTKDNKIKLDVDYYKAAQRGRIDHLSIVDPLEMLGKGSLTNRNRADMTLYKQQIYLVDNSISMKKPSKRFKI